jgi:hypothetical protein
MLFERKQGLDLQVLRVASTKQRYLPREEPVRQDATSDFRGQGTVLGPQETTLLDCLNREHDSLYRRRDKGSDCGGPIVALKP